MKPLFIHIPKTAGKAISQLNLTNPVSIEYIDTKIKAVEQLDPNYIMSAFIKHLPYSHLDQDILSQFSSIFTTVRNPWSRVVSLYNYADSIRPLITNSWFNQDKISFNEFLKRRLQFKMDLSFYRKHPYDQWGFQHDWINDNNKSLKIDVLRFEYIQEDLSEYLNKKIDIPVVNKGIYKNDYRTYYTDDTAQIVADWYHSDIKRWGFTFDSAATKNFNL